MTKYIRLVAEWGVRSDTPINQAQHFRLTNVLLLLMFFASIVVTAVCFIAGATDAALLNSTAPMVFATGLWLMKSGRTHLARMLVVTVCYVAGYVLSASIGPEAYFQFIFLFASASSIIFFSTDEPRSLTLGMLIPLVCFVVLEMTDYRPVLGMSRAQLSGSQIITIRVGSMVVLWWLIAFHFFYFVRDRKHADEQLISSAKMVALGRMAGGIAHEVNNPLQVIVSHAERLKKVARQGGDVTQIAAVADQIQSVAMRIAVINKGLLALSRDSGGDPLVDVPVRSIVRLALDFCRAHLESNQVELRMDQIPERWTVVGRETQLSEVVLNVLNNAYDAVRESSQKWVRIETSATRGWVELVITDSGPGVSPKLATRIFDPFFTTKPVGKGTGLGLSISQGIIAAHGGQIRCEPQLSGAKFVIRVPRGPDITPHVAREALS